MSVRVQNYCRTSFSFKIERLLQNLLRVVPQEHLIGLDSIILVGQVTSKKSREQKAGGLYWQKWRQRPATIEIALDEIYRGVPKIVLHLPFIPKFILANALYHEIGHHYQQRFTHAAKNVGREEFAEKYKKQLLQKAFVGWRLLFLPLAPLIRWMRRRVLRAA